VTVLQSEVERHYEFEPTGKPNPAEGNGVPACGHLYNNHKLIASIHMRHSVLNMYGTEDLSCGYDAGSPIASEEYTDEFCLTGTIRCVTVELI
jgi:arylsulfatase